MKDLIKQLIDDIAAIDGIAYAADDAGQLSDMYYSDDKRMPVKYPCALISVENGMSKQTKDVIREQLTIKVILADDASMVASKNAPDKHKDVALRLYDIRDKVIRMMVANGYQYQGFTKIVREMGYKELDLNFQGVTEIRM